MCSWLPQRPHRRCRYRRRSDAAELAELFKLFGDPTRARILFGLLEGGELCVCSIAEVVGVTESKVSQHLRLLRAANVVGNRKEGRMVYYRLRDSQVRLMLDLARDHLVRPAAST